jgi:RNA polymerase sigma factor (sigma-70 family)
MMCARVRSGGAGRKPEIFLPGGEDLAAVPSIGRATRVEGATPPEADFTHALYEEYANQIFRYCLHQLGSREEAEDAVQSTFLNAFRGLKRGVVPELEAAWLFKIAHNVCLSRRRSSWRRGRVESPADFAAVEELTPAPSRAADELIGLQDVLEQMPENQRRAILLREWQGLSYREIGAELELSQGAVETLIFRARRSLAAGLEEPPGRERRRLRRGVDLGGLAAGLKALLVGGGGAAKIAAAVAIVSATTVAAADPVVHHGRRPPARQPLQTPLQTAVQPHLSRLPQGAAASASAAQAAAARPAAQLVSPRQGLRLGHGVARAGAPQGVSTVRTRPVHPAAPPTGHGASRTGRSTTAGSRAHRHNAPALDPATRGTATSGANGRAVGKSRVTRAPQSRSAGKATGAVPRRTKASGAGSPAKQPPAGQPPSDQAATASGGKAKDPTG